MDRRGPRHHQVSSSGLTEITQGSKPVASTDSRSSVVLVCLVVLLSAAAILLMAMPFVLVRQARRPIDAAVPQLVSEAQQPG
jgi:hypothetical protein